MNGCRQSSLKSGISYGCRVSRKIVAIHLRFCLFVLDLDFYKRMVAHLNVCGQKLQRLTYAKTVIET